MWQSIQAILGKKVSQEMPVFGSATDINQINRMIIAVQTQANKCALRGFSEGLHFINLH